MFVRSYLMNSFDSVASSLQHEQGLLDVLWLLLLLRKFVTLAIYAACEVHIEWVGLEVRVSMSSSVIGEHIVEVVIWEVRVIVTVIGWLVNVMGSFMDFTVLVMLWMSIRVGEVFMAILDVVITVNAIVILVGITELIEVKLAL